MYCALLTAPGCPQHDLPPTLLPKSAVQPVGGPLEPDNATEALAVEASSSEHINGVCPGDVLPPERACSFWGSG